MKILGIDSSAKSASVAVTEDKKIISQFYINTESLPRDGYYAFVCEKCAPVFGYYGYFLTEQELNRRAREIYDRA